MRFAVFVSGSGTNLQALLDSEAKGDLAPGEIAVVVSNQPGTGALDRAQRAGKEKVLVHHRDYPDRRSFEAQLLHVLEDHAVDAVILAGFMRILTGFFLEKFPHRVINTHPSLLPSFPGMHGAKQAIEHGVKRSGCTVHFVEAGVDTGPIIAQECVPVLDGDTPEKLQQRIQDQEHQLLPQAAQLLASGRLSCQGRRVTVLPAQGNHAN